MVNPVESIVSAYASRICSGTEQILDAELVAAQTGSVEQPVKLTEAERPWRTGKRSCCCDKRDGSNEIE